MNRIEKKLQSLQEKKEKAFITYITAGLPDMEHCAKLIRVQEEAGLDILELGIPFSDPAADGPVIQDASYRSILKGTNLRKCFELVDGVRKDGCELAIVFMMYYNTVLHYGLEAFAEKCAEVGVDGLIIPDLPLEEQQPLKDALAKQNATILIQLVAPVSDKRIPEILKDARGFVYCVSSLGVTGMRRQITTDVGAMVELVKKSSDLPAAIGFGISGPEQAKKMAEVSDGVIVGSAIVKLVEKYGKDAVPYVAEFVKSVKDAIRE